MNAPRTRKLQLNRETIRTLSSREMTGIAGGAAVKLTEFYCTDPAPKPNSLMTNCETPSTPCVTAKPANSCFCTFNRVAIRVR